MINREEGFTLFEIFIAIAIIGVILSAMLTFYFSSQDVFSFSQERINFQRAQRLIVARISRYIRKATYIDDNPSGNDEVRIGYINEGNEDGIAFGLDDNGYFYYRKRISGSWGSIEKIFDMKAKDLSFSFSNNILTISLTLLKENGDKDYSFANKFFPRYSVITTP